LTVTLPQPFHRVNGNVVSAVTLGGGEGAVLTSMSSCDINQDGVVNGADVAAATSQVLNPVSCGLADLDGDGRCTASDVQRVINAVLGGACVSP
jgi:hypothetical protein